MIFQNFGFNRQIVTAATAAPAVFPTANNIVRVEVQVSGSNQNLSTAEQLNILGPDANTGSLSSDTALNATSNNVYINASSVTAKLNGANIGTIAMVFRTTNTKSNSSARWYLCDGRSSIGSIGDSYINQYDGMGSDWDGGNFWAAQQGQSLTKFTLNNTNLTNGVNNNVGGTNWYQWTGAPANTAFPDYRLLVLTFDAVKTTTGNFNFWGNSNNPGTESPGGIRYGAIAMWSSILGDTEVQSLYDYYKNTLGYNI